MNIDEAIRHCKEVADRNNEAIKQCKEMADRAAAQGRCPACAADHRQLAEWLKELRAYRESGLTPAQVIDHDHLLFESMTRTYGPMKQKVVELLKAYEEGRLVELTEDTPKWISAILAERKRQDQKWGYTQENTYCEWASVLAEETGELAKELNELNFGRGDQERMETEAVQVAAVALAILEQSDVAQSTTVKAAVALGRLTNQEAAHE